MVMARQIGKGLVDGRRRAVERIDVITDSAVHVGSVNTLLSFRINARRNDSVDEIRLNITSESCLEQLLLVPGALRGGYGSERRVIRPQSTRQELT